MEKGKNNINNGVNIIIAVFILEVVGLIIALFLVLNGNLTLRFDNFPTRDNQEQPPVETKKETTNIAKTYTYESIKGLYKEKNVVDQEREKDTTLAPKERYLLLNQNGTFYYQLPVRTASGYYGNYKIEGNKIILTYWFYVSSAIKSLNDNETKTNTIIINEDGTIKDSYAPNYNNVKEEISLTQADNSEYEKLKDSLDLHKTISAYLKNNN